VNISPQVNRESFQHKLTAQRIDHWLIHNLSQQWISSTSQSWIFPV